MVLCHRTLQMPLLSATNATSLLTKQLERGKTRSLDRSGSHKTKIDTFFLFIRRLPRMADRPQRADELGVLMCSDGLAGSRLSYLICREIDGVPNGPILPIGPICPGLYTRAASRSARRAVPISRRATKRRIRLSC